MKNSVLDSNGNRINTKEELIELLRRYRGILTDSVINYLNSLIELEFSVVREYISDDDRKSLSELEIYKKIAIYNIYNRALNLFNEMQFEISDTVYGLRISTSLSDRNISLFDFGYSDFLNHKDKIPDGYITMQIGTISLYQTIESQELMEAELELVMNKLEKLYNAHNPYPTRPGVAGGPWTQWEFAHIQEIEKYEKRFAKLDKLELSDNDKREIEITNRICNLLLEDYDLSNKSFEEKKEPVFGPKKTKLQKKLVKRQPNLTIVNHIKYM